MSSSRIPLQEILMDYFDLGTLTRPVSTRSPEAQCWFDRGLVWSY
ncbi:hypothetical protein [Streptomyces mirabilis]